MKEQVITPRISARTGAAGKGRASSLVQKPARRDRATRATTGGSVRRVLAYLPLAGKLTLAILAGVLLFAGYRAAASASFFQPHTIDINSTTRADATEINRIVRRATTQTGVWRADLTAISNELERVPWVRRAVVSRVLPDGLRVRITERAPLAVVHLSGGKFVWVDEDAVLLDAMTPSDHMPAFFIRGWDESGTPQAQAENLERVRQYSELLHEWSADALSERVSEVNLADLRDVRAQLRGDDSQIEVRLGGKDFGNRLRRALKVLDEQRNTSRGPFITRIETLENRTIIGTGPGTQATNQVSGQVASESAGNMPSSSTDSATTSSPARHESRAATSSRTSKKATEEKGRKQKEPQAREERNGKEEAKSRAKGETRPRRVG